jgi:hypothetical protein
MENAEFGSWRTPGQVEMVALTPPLVQERTLPRYKLLTRKL